MKLAMNLKTVDVGADIVDNASPQICGDANGSRSIPVYSNLAVTCSTGMLLRGVDGTLAEVKLFLRDALIAGLGKG